MMKEKDKITPKEFLRLPKEERNIVLGMLASEDKVDESEDKDSIKIKDVNPDDYKDIY